MGTASAEPTGTSLRRVVLLGNPNTGKTTLFNRLSGLRHKSANFPGTTLEARIASIDRDGGFFALIDLPGVYSLELDQVEAEIGRQVLAGSTGPEGENVASPDVVLVVADATNLPRNLCLVGEAMRRRLPIVVVVNMIDLARRRGIHIDADRLAESLGCDVVCTNARTGEGIDAVGQALERATVSGSGAPAGEADLRQWADALYTHSTEGDEALAEDQLTDRLDRVATHPVAGLALFALIMCGLFWVIFKLTQHPMEWIDLIFGWLGGAVASLIPDGILQSLLAEGVVGGVGATVVFLPQICFLFFMISLLEDTGYLARAAFVADRLLRPFGLPGHALIPLLSSHACALPGIIACRSIPQRRQRLATILVAPYMSCSARIPVYVLLALVLFPDSPGMAALAMVGCYVLGAAAGLFSAFIVRRTLLKGPATPLALELPSYKWPSVRNALLTTWDRAIMFLRKAGTVILAIVILLWWLESFPRTDPPTEAIGLRAQASQVESLDPPRSAELSAEADRIETAHAKSNSFAGLAGRTVQPVFAPLGFDWQLTVGVLTSFAAREVFVSTMAVVLAGEEEGEGVIERITTATRADGRPVFTTATAWSLLVYFVLALQCLPTLAVTAREAGGWRWAVIQLAWMQFVAYGAALVVYQSLRLAGVT